MDLKAAEAFPTSISQHHISLKSLGQHPKLYPFAFSVPDLLWGVSGLLSCSHFGCLLSTIEQSEETWFGVWVLLDEVQPPEFIDPCLSVE